ncbi:leucyl aminopeptidase [Clostridia bacterium]|nr:leucyl aminopeptidase [Clostridia bacterium]
MEFRILTKDEARRPGEIRIIPLVRDAYAGISSEEIALLENLGKKGVFSAKPQESYFSYIKENSVYQAVVFVGVKENDKESFEKAIGLGVKEAARNKATTAEIILRGAFCEIPYLRLATKACVLADYRFDKFKSEEDKKPSLVTVKMVLEALPEEAAQNVQEAMVIAEAVNLARDLVNEPANRQSADDLATFAHGLGQEYESLSVEVFHEKKIESLNMQAFLAVAGASANPPRFIVMRYQGNPESDKMQLGIAGKGIMYDTGGLSLKPSDHMKTMKTDMGGAAATIAMMEALARNHVKVNVVAVVAACENAIGAGNYRPGDIIDSMSGKTIFIANTDAEGRLTLADAVTYLSQVEKPERIIDIATLTGAAEVALGQTVTAVVSTDDDFYALAETASEEAGEKIWRLPAFEEFKEFNESEEADISNSGGRYAGAITAGLFVGAFVNEEPWIHLDIAGPSYTEKPSSIQQKGATGSGTALLYEIAKKLAEQV